MKKIALLTGFILAAVLAPKIGKASVLYTVSANQTVEEGQTFEVDWLLNTSGQSINTIDLKLKFSKDTLEVVDASPGNSLLNLWINPPKFDNLAGTLRLTGGITHGISGDKVPIFRSVFRAKAPGRGEIVMENDSSNLKNDGQGTPETLTFTALSFPIVASGGLPLSISSETHPDQNVWYHTRDLELRLQLKPDEVYSYSFSANPDMYPENRQMEIGERLEYQDLPDGIYYFKVNSKIADNAWQEAGIYRIQIDATSPEQFKPVMGSDPANPDAGQFLSFSTLDKTSGISHYETRMGWSSGWKRTESPLPLTRLFAGDRISVRAYDKAGNFTETAIDYGGYINRGNIIFVGLMLVLVLSLGTVIYYRNKKRSA